MKKFAILISLTCAAPGPVCADVPELPSDNRMQILPYDEQDIYTIHTKYGYQTSIVFSPQEQIETISLGDRSLWQIIPSGNRLFIRPMEENVTTNMTILTDRHSYQFDLKSGSEKSEEVVYVARFIYPKGRSEAHGGMMPPPMMMPPAAPPMTQNPPPGTYVPYHEPAMENPASAPAPVAAPPENAPAAAAINYSYTFSGPDELAPLQVFDDGKSTFIRYRNMDQALPNAYIIDAGGRETQAAYHVEKELMVIDRVAGELALKNSTGTVNVYNETLNPQQ